MADSPQVNVDRVEVEVASENLPHLPPPPTDLTLPPKNDSSVGESEEQKIDESDDKELYDLLDSALEDFKDSAVDTPTPGTSDDVTETSTAVSASVAATSNDEWSDEFIEHATAQFQDAMKAFLGDDASLSEEFRKMAEVTGKAMSSQEPGSDLSESLAQTLKGLAENADAVSNDLSDEEISQLLSNIGMSSEDSSGDNESADLLNIMKNVMQNLLSKELLYPAIKEIVDKYPHWLAENRPSMAEEEHSKYRQQYELMKKACDEFEAEKDEDPAEVKKARFEKVLELMQKMQAFGHPPKDLVGDMTPGFELDEQGNPKILGLPSLSTNGTDSCSLM